MYRKGRGARLTTATNHNHINPRPRRLRRGFIAERDRALCRCTQHNGLTTISLRVAHSRPSARASCRSYKSRPCPHPQQRQTNTIASPAESTSVSYCPTVSFARPNRRRRWVTTDEGVQLRADSASFFRLPLTHQETVRISATQQQLRAWPLVNNFQHHAKAAAAVPHPEPLRCSRGGRGEGGTTCPERSGKRGGPSLAPPKRKSLLFGLLRAGFASIGDVSIAAPH